jgi:uncharacterized membrane protein
MPLGSPRAAPLEATGVGASSGAIQPAGLSRRRRTSASLSDSLKSTSQNVTGEYQPGSDPQAPAFASPPDEPQPFTPVGEMQQPPAVLPQFAPVDAAPNAVADPANPMTAPPAAPAAALASPAGVGGLHSVLKRSRTADSADSDAPGSVPAAPSFSDANPYASNMQPAASAPLSQTASRRAAPPMRDEASIQDMTITAHSPQLRLDMVGPQSIAVNKPAAYVINLMNEGDAAATDVQLRLEIPGFVEVKSSEATSGEARLQADAAGSRFVWNVPRVEARGAQTLRLQLIATEGQPFELGMEWICRPTTTRAAISVRQPRLEVSLAGPADMIFGEEKPFSLTVSNPGTGVAENVTVSLASGAAGAQRIDVGTVRAGEQKEIPLNIVAGEAGEMELRAVAQGDGGLTAEALGKVIVRRAELALTVEAPRLKYAGTDAVYVVTLANSGNAAAEEAIVSVTLPSGAKYLGGIEGASASGSTVKWRLATLPAGTQRAFQIQCQLNAAGVNRLTAQAGSKSGNAATGMAETQVEAVADLKLVVNDPAGASPVGEDIEYEVKVMNRGTQAARQVRIVMQFSTGVEPVEFSGGQGKLVPGQVVCEPLPMLEAGEQVIVKVKARASQAGTHQYRVEVTSGEADARAVSEGTSKFYLDSLPPSATSSAARTAGRPTVAAPGAGVMKR